MSAAASCMEECQARQHAVNVRISVEVATSQRGPYIRSDAVSKVLLHIAYWFHRSCSDVQKKLSFWCNNQPCMSFLKLAQFLLLHAGTTAPLLKTVHADIICLLPGSGISLWW